jgi:hypothetical protein
MKAWLSREASGQSWDWKTAITHAQEGDRFNIGVSTRP